MQGGRDFAARPLRSAHAGSRKMHMAIANFGMSWRPLSLICVGFSATAALALSGAWAVAPK